VVDRKELAAIAETQVCHFDTAPGPSGHGYELEGLAMAVVLGSYTEARRPNEHNSLNY